MGFLGFQLLAGSKGSPNRISEPLLGILPPLTVDGWDKDAKDAKQAVSPVLVALGLAIFSPAEALLEGKAIQWLPGDCCSVDARDLNNEWER